MNPACRNLFDHRAAGKSFIIIDGECSQCLREERDRLRDEVDFKNTYIAIYKARLRGEKHELDNDMYDEGEKNVAELIKQNEDLQAKLEEVIRERDQAEVMKYPAENERIGELEEELKAMRETLVAAQKEAAMWKANHDNQVMIKCAVLDRPDLGDRAQRVQELIKQNEELRKQIEEKTEPMLVLKMNNRTLEIYKKEKEYRYESYEWVNGVLQHQYGVLSLEENHVKEWLNWLSRSVESN